jgi:hypothetical protein
MATIEVRPDTVCVFQDSSEGMPEPALLICALEGGIIEIQQEDRWININANSLKAIIKAVNKIAKSK